MNRYFGRIFLLMAAVFFFVLFTGCGRSPEALKKGAVKFVSAQNLMEMVVGRQLRGVSYMPGLEQSVRNDFINTCKKARVPLKTPFEELLKKGNFDEVRTEVLMKTLQESSNPITPNDTAFKVTFRAVKRMEGSELTYIMAFVVYNSPEGPCIIDSSCCLEFNGKEEELNVVSMLVILGDAGRDGTLTKGLISKKTASEAAAKRRKDSKQD